MEFDAREVAAMRILVNKMATNHRFAALAVTELAKSFLDSDQRGFCIRLAANLDAGALDFMAVMGETAKMMKKDNSWEDFSVPRK